MDDNIILIEEIEDDEDQPLIGIAQKKDGSITWGTNLSAWQTVRILNGIANSILENELDG